MSKLLERINKYIKYNENIIESEVCEKIADEHAIGFKNFCDEKYHYNIEEFSTEKLLEIYKKQL
jgi:hypothetical protein